MDCEIILWFDHGDLAAINSVFVIMSLATTTS